MGSSSSDFNSASNSLWVLLRGWTRESRHWRGFPQELSDTFAADAMGSAQVIGLDLPGAGTERGRVTPLSIREIALDVRERFSRQFNGDGRSLFIVGISMGGMVALEWANLFPEDCSGLVLINSSLAGLSSPWSRLKVGNLPKIARLAFSKDRVKVEEEILKLTTHLGDSEIKAIAQEFSKIAEVSSVSKGTFFRQLVAASSFFPRKFPAVSSLILSSARDQLVDSSCSVAIARVLKDVHEIHPDAGHDLPLDDPKWVAQHIAAWYRRSLASIM